MKKVVFLSFLVVFVCNMRDILKDTKMGPRIYISEHIPLYLNQETKMFSGIYCDLFQCVVMNKWDAEHENDMKVILTINQNSKGDFVGIIPSREGQNIEQIYSFPTFEELLQTINYNHGISGIQCTSMHMQTYLDVQVHNTTYGLQIRLKDSIVKKIVQLKKFDPSIIWNVMRNIFWARSRGFSCLGVFFQKIPKLIVQYEIITNLLLENTSALLKRSEMPINNIIGWSIEENLLPYYSGKALFVAIPLGTGVFIVFVVGNNFQKTFIVDRKSKLAMLLKVCIVNSGVYLATIEELINDPSLNATTKPINILHHIYERMQMFENPHIFSVHQK